MSLPGTPTGLLSDDVHVQASTKQVPPPRVECRPHPQAAKLIPPAVGVLLLLRLRQDWLLLLEKHRHGMSSPRGWARLGEQFRPRVRTQLRTFFLLGKVRKKTFHQAHPELHEHELERAKKRRTSSSAKILKASTKYNNDLLHNPLRNASLRRTLRC